MTLNQRLFNRFMEQHYRQLLSEFPQRDMLHSAYLIVFYTSNKYLPTADTYERLLSRAYYQSLIREMQYYQRCIIPDPLFWLYRQNEQDELLSTLLGEAPEMVGDTDYQLSDKKMKYLREFARKYMSPEEAVIFRLALLQQCSVAQIAEIVGKPKADVRKSLHNIEQLLRKKYKKNKRNSNI